MMFPSQKTLELLTLSNSFRTPKYQPFAATLKHSFPHLRRLLSFTARFETYPIASYLPLLLRLHGKNRRNLTRCKRAHSNLLSLFRVGLPPPQASSLRRLAFPEDTQA